jgi:hypothetical protein
MNIKILIPIIIVLVGYLGFLLSDLVRIPSTKIFPKWAWGIICCLAIPVGGIAYYFCGRDSEEDHDDE